jgi:hypothetical protein
MAANEALERLEQWAEKVAEESRRLPADITDDELLRHEAGWYADYYAHEPEWGSAAADDPAKREWLIVEEGMSPQLADAVLAKLRELTAAPS